MPDFQNNDLQSVGTRREAARAGSDKGRSQGSPLQARDAQNKLQHLFLNIIWTEY